MNQQLKKRIWIVHHFLAFLFGIALVFSMFGCSIPLYKTEITPTTPLDWSDCQAWGYQNDLQTPSRAITLPKCQGRAAREYHALKDKGYDACILMGSKASEGHVEASALKKGIPVDLKGMRITHLLTESAIYRVNMRPIDQVTWQDDSHETWLRYGR